MNWDQFYLGIAFAVSQKSPDPDTKHGCVLVRDKRPLSFGFNGFPRGVDDSDLPLTRPDKYFWMFHSERAALANTDVRPEGATAYVTGQCCNECLYSLWQHGIKRIVCVNRKAKMITPEMEEWSRKFLVKTKMEYTVVEPDNQLIWITNLSDYLICSGFSEIR